MVLISAHHIYTGLSICQELALDEDDGVGEADAVSSLLQDGEMQTPVQLSNALMKALKVGGDERAESTSESKNQESKRTSKIVVHYVGCSVHSHEKYMHLLLKEPQNIDCLFLPFHVAWCCR